MNGGGFSGDASRMNGGGFSGDASRMNGGGGASSFAYEDIIGRERPVHNGDEFSFRHPKMSNEDRAKIFAPFAALRGFEASIEKEAGAFRARRYNPPADGDR